MNVLILGAGFSAPAGIPGADHFVRDALQQWESIARTAGLRSQEAVRFRQNVEALWQEHRKPDIEKFLHKVNGSPEDRQRVTRFVKIVLSGLVRRYIRDELRPVRRRMLDADYEGFIRYLEIHRPAIVSFNYDLICEYLIRAVLGMRDDHRASFDRVGGSGAASAIPVDGGPATGGARASSLPGGTRPASRESVLVLKPQGSVSWTHCPDCGFAEDHVRHVTDRLLSHPPACVRCGSVLEPLIVAPAAKARSGNIAQLEETWHEVDRVLGSAKAACVCGLSLQRAHPRFLESVRREVGRARRLRRLTVIDPDDRARRRARELFESALGVEEDKGPRRRKRFLPFGKQPRETEEPDLRDGDAYVADPEGPGGPAEDPEPFSISVDEYESFADWAAGVDAG